MENYQNTESDNLRAAIRAKKENLRVEIRRQNTQKLINAKRMVRLLQAEEQRRGEQQSAENLDVRRELQTVATAYEQQDLPALQAALTNLRRHYEISDAYKTHNPRHTENSKTFFEEFLQQGTFTILLPFLSALFADEDALQVTILFLTSNAAFCVDDFYKIVLEQNALESVLAMAFADRLNVREMALATIANLTSECAPMKEYLLREYGIGARLFDEYAKQRASDDYTVTASLLICSLLDSQAYSAEFEEVEGLMRLINGLLSLKIPESVTYLCYGVQQLLDRDCDNLTRVNKHYNAIFVKIIQYLRANFNTSKQQIENAIDVLTTIAAIDIEQDIYQLMQLGIHDVLYRYCHFPDDEIKRKALFGISNLCASGESIVDLIFEHNLIIVELQRASEVESFKVKREAYYGLANLMISCSEKQAAMLSDHGYARVLLRALDYYDNKLLVRVVEAILQYLNKGKSMMAAKKLHNNPLMRVLECEGLEEKLQRVTEQNQKNKKIQKLIDQIHSEHYQVEFEDEDADEQAYDENDADAQPPYEQSAHAHEQQQNFLHQQLLAQQQQQQQQQQERMFSSSAQQYGFRAQCEDALLGGHN